MRSISPVASLLFAVGLVAYFLGVSAPRTPAQMGYTAQAGSIVTVADTATGSPEAWVWGYLVNA